MKSILRIICASAIIILVFNLLDWCLNKLLLWIFDWSLLWFIITCVIANSVLVYGARIIISFVGVLIDYSKTHRQLLVMKWVLLAVSWGMAILTFLIVFQAADFYITKMCVFAILVILLNIPIPIFVNRIIKAKNNSYRNDTPQFSPATQKIAQQLSEYGYETAEISMKIVGRIQDGKTTYPEAIKLVKALKEANVINEHQELLIINMVNSHIKK